MQRSRNVMRAGELEAMGPGERADAGHTDDTVPARTLEENRSYLEETMKMVRLAFPVDLDLTAVPGSTDEPR